MREILEKASAAGPGRDAISQTIGDYYGACIDETAVDAKGVAPLTPELKRIAAAEDKAALIEAVARVQLLGPNPLFNFYSSSDLHNASEVIAYIDQGGLSLPDRDYYLTDDPKMTAARASLAEVGFNHPQDVLAQFRGTPETLRAYAAPGPLLTDDHPILDQTR